MNRKRCWRKLLVKIIKQSGKTRKTPLAVLHKSSLYSTLVMFCVIYGSQMCYKKNRKKNILNENFLSWDFPRKLSKPKFSRENLPRVATEIKIISSQFSRDQTKPSGPKQVSEKNFPNAATTKMLRRWRGKRFSMPRKLFHRVTFSLLQVFLFTFRFLAQAVDEHESLVLGLERRRSTLPARFPPTSSLADEV